MRENFAFFYTRCSMRTMWKNEKFGLTKKYFVKLTLQYVISLVITLLSRNFCQKCLRLNRSNSHNTVWKNEKFSLTKKLFRQINSLVISLVKSLLSRNFCQKCAREYSHNFHPLCLTNYGKLSKCKKLMQVHLVRNFQFYLLLHASRVFF